MTSTDFRGNDYKVEIDGILVDSEYFKLTINEYPHGNLKDASINLSFVVNPDLAQTIRRRLDVGDHIIKLVPRSQGGKQYLVRAILESSKHINETKLNNEYAFEVRLHRNGSIEEVTT